MLLNLAKQAGIVLTSRKLILTTAESCTGGLVAQAITSIPGSSAWFDRGFVTYSNQAKQDMLAVPKTLIETYGAVSEQTACAMAEGALRNSQAQISLAITGIAGPDGGTPEKPVGTVWIAWAGVYFATLAEHYFFEGKRMLIRKQAAKAALEKLLIF